MNPAPADVRLIKEAHTAPRPQPAATQSIPTRQPRRHLWMWVFALIVLIVCAYFLYAHFANSSASSSGKENATALAAANRSTPVLTATARTGSLNIYLTGLGSVTPFSTVTVRSRVDGQVDK